MGRKIGEKAHIGLIKCLLIRDFVFAPSIYYVPVFSLSIFLPGRSLDSGSLNRPFPPLFPTTVCAFVFIAIMMQRFLAW